MQLPKELSLAEIASIAGGKIVGSSEVKVSSVAFTPLSAKAGDLALVFDQKLLKRIDECKATAVVIPEGTTTNLPCIVVERPMLALQRMLKSIAPKRFYPELGVHPTAVVHPSCKLGENVAIGPLVSIGPNTIIGANTIIMAGCLIG